MNPEGQIDITLTVLSSGRKEVTILNNRPVHAAKLLVGKTIDEALTIIPLLYHVCGKAQGSAAINALQAAKNTRSDETTYLSRTVLSDVELLREHLLRIFLDWPCLLEGDEDTHDTSQQMTEFMQFSSRFEAALFRSEKPFSLETIAAPEKDLAFKILEDLESFLQTHIFGCTPDLWLKAKARDVIFHWMRQEKCLSARSCAVILEKGWAQEGQTVIPFLPKLTADQCASLLFPNNHLQSDEFIASPSWEGLPHETSALSRYHQHPLLKLLLAHCGTGLLTRHVSRLVELGLVFARIKHMIGQLASPSLPVQIKRNASISTTPDFGVGMVDASRGILIHGAYLEGELIKDYKILAPTEWNFHPEGVLASALSNIKGTDEAHIKKIADLLIPAIDPCTKTSLEVTYA